MATTVLEQLYKDRRVVVKRDDRVMMWGNQKIGRIVKTEDIPRAYHPQRYLAIVECRDIEKDLGLFETQKEAAITILWTVLS